MSDDYTLHHGDCLEVLRAMPDASVDAVVTDPPYGLSNTNPRRFWWRVAVLPCIQVPSESPEKGAPDSRA